MEKFKYYIAEDPSDMAKHIIENNIKQSQIVSITIIDIRLIDVTC